MLISLLKFLKKIGINVDSLLSFISDCKNIVLGAYSCMMALAIILDIVHNNGSNVWSITMSFLVTLKALY